MPSCCRIIKTLNLKKGVINRSMNCDVFNDAIITFMYRAFYSVNMFNHSFILFINWFGWSIIKWTALGFHESEYRGHPFRVSGFFPSTLYQGSVQYVISGVLPIWRHPWGHQFVPCKGFYDTLDLPPLSTAYLSIGTYENCIFSWPYINSFSCKGEGSELIKL